MARGKRPTIGPQDFARLARICTNASHQAQRLDDCGFPRLARMLRYVALRTAEVDSELYLADRASGEDHGK